jgi:hypothetical protein
MNMLILIAKVAIVLFFLFMFLRSDKLVWGIGLLTVTSAILLDTLLSTFGWEEIVATLGFFFFVFAGVIFSGAAIWFWLVVRPYLPPNTDKEVESPEQIVERPVVAPIAEASDVSSNPAVDRKMLYEQMQSGLGPEDLLDLTFDLGWSENDVVQFNQDNDELILRIINTAEAREQLGALALAVERILTPLPVDKLPRLERISAESPQTILRHYLIAHYSLEELENMATQLGIDWELIGGDRKQTKIRNLLWYLIRRNRLQELIDLMAEKATV